MEAGVLEALTPRLREIRFAESRMSIHSSCFPIATLINRILIILPPEM